MDIKKIQSIASKYRSIFIEQDELINETVIFCLENNIGDDKIEQAVELCCKRLKKEASKHDLKKAKSIYNDDGECMDDNYYFVDPNTVEQFGERKGISDDLREKGLKVTQTMNLLNHLIWRFGKSKRLTDYKRFSRYAFLHIQKANNNDVYFKNTYTKYWNNYYLQNWGYYAKH